MKLHDLYKSIYQIGIKNDPRGEDYVKNDLKHRKDQYKTYSIEKKDEMGSEYLKNPYFDTRVLYGKRNREISDSILVGLTIGTDEILMADLMKDAGQNIDLVIGSYPDGKAMATSFHIIESQIGFLQQIGIPVNIAEGIILNRVNKLKRRIAPMNLDREVSTAILMDTPYMCVHSPVNNITHTFIKNLLREKRPEFLCDIVEVLMKESEFVEAEKIGLAVKILSGNLKSICGNIIIDMTGALLEEEKMFDIITNIGKVGTVIVKKLSEKCIKFAQKYKLNVIATNYVAVESLGLNLMFQALEKRGINFDLVGCSGYRHFRDKRRVKYIKYDEFQ
ncbi:hypothetical protein KAJ27_24325 [bacterium]|nr:hypothetical protein [bacterium]